MLLDDDHGLLAGAHKIVDHLCHLGHDDRGEAFHGLVEQQQAGVGHERARDGEHLLLAAGQMVAQVASTLRERGKHPIDSPDVPRARARHGFQMLLDGQRWKH